MSKITTAVQVIYKIMYNFKIIEYFFLLINSKIKKRVLVFGIIIYEKIKMNGRLAHAGTRTRKPIATGAIVNC